MPIPRNRVKKYIKKKVPSGRVLTHYKKWKKAKRVCGICSAPLYAKSKKKINRKFGGELCARCAMEILKLRTRVKYNDMKIEDVELKYRKYIL